MTMTTTAAPAQTSAPAEIASGANDFDFLHGAWRVHNRKLRERLAGSGDWEEFEARAVERPFWDGQGNHEEWDGVLPDGTRVRGQALRLYSPVAREWSIHWSDSRSGVLDPPMTGRFRDGVGEFTGQEVYRGRAVAVRFLWSSLGPDRARWEQAYSADGGLSWETNWIMDFTREGGS
jgi:hypothetical protein